MGHLWKYLQRAGLVTSLLAGGMLEGLLAPPPSEAVPDVTLQVDGQGTTTRILNTAGTCTVETGYTACYPILTGTIVGTAPSTTCPTCRQYKVQSATGATARLRVADLAGQDKMSLVGMHIVPVQTTWGSTDANTNETHVLTITISNTFSSAINSNNAGDYVWAVRAGGEFRAGPLTANACVSSTGALANCNTVGDSVQYTGKGTFSPSLTNRDILSSPGPNNNNPVAANSLPLSFTVASPTNPIVSFDGLKNATLGQENPAYPKFLCDDDGPTTSTGGGGLTCKPSISQTMTVTLKGPDSFVLVNGGDGFGASCAATLTATQQKQISLLTKLVTFLDSWEIRHPNPDLREFINKIKAFLAVVNTVDQTCGGATLVNLDIAVAAALDQVAFAADGAVVAEPALQGTITINKYIINDFCEGPCSNHTFNFRIKNQSTLAETTHSVETGGTSTGTTTVTVPAGTYNVDETLIPSGWALTASSCSGGNTSGVTVSAGGNVTCNFTNSPVTSDDIGTIRLSWGETPSDLDSHLYVPNSSHVSYLNHGSLEISPYAALDLDDTTSFGPENIAVVRRMKGTYQYFVHNYIDDVTSSVLTDRMTNSPARVELIRNGGTTVYTPPSGEGTNRYWHVFNAVVDSETCAVTIVPVNVWRTDPPTPVTTTENLCP